MATRKTQQDRNRMQRTADKFETKLSRRARQRFLFDKPERERPHEWVKLGKDRYIYTNDGTVNQYKAQVVQDSETQLWHAIIRTMSKHPDGVTEHDSLYGAMSRVGYEVQALIQQDFDFYGPDKTGI